MLRTVKYSSSDKLALALACLAGILAILLFWADRTALFAYISIAAIGGLAIYPVFHWIKQPEVRSVLIMLMVFLLGRHGWNIYLNTKREIHPLNAKVNTSEGAILVNDSGTIGSAKISDTTVVGISGPVVTVEKGGKMGSLDMSHTRVYANPKDWTNPGESWETFLSIVSGCANYLPAVKSAINVSGGSIKYMGFVA